MKPFDIEDVNYHMGHLFIDVMKQRPNEICQIDAATGEKETNASVLSRSIRLAQSLRRFGLKPGDVLALGGRNHLDLHIPYYAALLNGYPIAGVDPLFKFDEIKSLFKVSVPRVAFCQMERYGDYVQAAQELGFDTKVITFEDGEHSMASFIQEYHDGEPEDKFEVAIFDLEKVYTWLTSTGGTTGVIKLAAFKHRIWLDKMFSMRALFSRDVDKEVSENKPALNLSPIQWISGYFNALSLPLMRQIKIQTSAPATPEHIIDIINKYKPVTSMLGPSLATSILKSEKECDLKCFDSIIVSGGKVYEDIIIELRKRARPDAVVIEMYGQTENLGPILMPNLTGPIGSCGKGMYPWHQGKLVDPETGKEITEPNKPGELWTKGVSFSEYYNNPEETANVISEDGWFKTGDILYIDEDGNYFFVERMKMLIKYRNYHVVPAELEAVIREHPGVADVSVTCVPHKEDGEHPVACVVRATGARAPVTAQQIKDLIANKLSDVKRLRGGVVFVEKLPYTSTGKIAKGKLRQLVLNAHRE